tara:strand:- start:1850 stop:2662 length:813 start_codon:yes stop_codon:yes gene_type:complete
LPLFVCSLPIGHQQDITHRVRDCLTTVNVIFCEDTRVTKRLLQQMGIFKSQQLIRMDQYQEKRSLDIFDRMATDQDVAYVSDAGAPGLADPGALLVAHARSQAIPVHILPGASALTTFISGCGCLFSDFYFGGFLPKKQSDAMSKLDFVIASRMVGIWFESPKRVLGIVEMLYRFHPDLPVVFAKELTKPHDAFFVGTVAQISNQLSSVMIKGEWVFMIDARHYIIDQTPQYKAIATALKVAELSGKQVKQLAPLFDCKKNDLYEYYQQL